MASHIQKVKVLKIPISLTTYDELINIVFSTHKTLLISPIASQTITLAHFDKKLEEKLLMFDYLVPDSQWIKWSIFFLYGKRLKRRIYGPDLMLKICAETKRRKHKIFLYGNTQNTLIKLKKKLKFLFPNINIVGFYPSNFTILSPKEKESLVDKIINSEADILFVCLGSPLQEIFSEEIANILKTKIKNIVIIPVGAAFDFISGNKSQAPKWVQNSGLEWLFRLLNEPKRLWKRYLIYGPIFILLIFKQKITQSY